MNSFQVTEKFHQYLNEDKCSEGLATVKSLRDLIDNCSAATITEYDSILKKAIEELSQSEHSLAPIKSASELFMRYITYCKLDNRLVDFKSNLLNKADLFIDKISKNIDIIADLCGNLCGSLQKTVSNILILSGSKIVWETLVEFVRNYRRKKINIYIIGHPKPNYLLKMSQLSTAISFIPIDFRSLTFYLKSIHVVLVGAEAVVGNGGIINEMGTFNLAILAKQFNIDFFVLTEIIRFSQLYPLDQNDIPNEFQRRCVRPNSDNNNNSEYNGETALTTMLPPEVDYTPPEYIRMIVTDIGYIPPSNVGEEVFKLYL